MKTHLSELNIGKEHFDIMADRATSGGTKTVGHYIDIDKKTFVDILNLAR